MRCSVRVSIDEVASSRISIGGRQKLIEKLNIRAKAGQRIAIVGPTGCGKTTLINLLIRFYDPTDGKISVATSATAAYTMEFTKRVVGLGSEEKNIDFSEALVKAAKASA